MAVTDVPFEFGRRATYGMAFDELCIHSDHCSGPQWVRDDFVVLAPTPELARFVRRDGGAYLVLARDGPPSIFPSFGGFSVLVD